MPCKILCTLHACGTHEVHTRSAYTKCIACVCVRTILLYNSHTSQLLAALIRIRIFIAMQIVLAECHINHILNTNQTTLWICYTTSTTHIWIMIRRQPQYRMILFAYFLTIDDVSQNQKFIVMGLGCATLCKDTFYFVSHEVHFICLPFTRRKYFCEKL